MSDLYLKESFNKKRQNSIYLLLIGFIIYSIAITGLFIRKEDINPFPKIFTKENIKYDTLKVKVTCYSATEAQCDKEPSITASGKKIKSNDSLYLTTIKWCAVSQDFLKQKILSFGDTIQILGCGVYDGKWIVQDAMNSRFKRRIDFLVTEKFSKENPLMENAILIIKKK